MAQPRMAAPMGAPRHLSDEELLAKYDVVEMSEYDIPQHMIPDGMIYEWKREEVYGKAEHGYIADLRSKGWQVVPADRHDGVFMAPGQPEGTPINRKGLILMEITEHSYDERQRVAGIRAKMQVRDKEVSLGKAPSGTGPRDHPKVRPMVRKGYEAVAVEE